MNKYLPHCLAALGSDRPIVLFILIVFALSLTRTQEADVLAAPGDLDSTFGVGGKVATDFGPGSPNFGQDTATAVAIQPDGKLIAAGQTFGFNFIGVAIARYRTDGSLDTTFGSGGKISATVQVRAQAVLIQPNGKLIVIGNSRGTGPAAFVVMRLNTDGSMDPTFGSGGLVSTDLGAGAFASGGALQPDGKIIVVGTIGRETVANDFVVLRYNSNGGLDPTFGSAGKVTVDFFNNQDFGRAVAIESNGRIVVAGSAITTPVNQTDFAVARFNSDGSLDATFGTGGKVTTSFGSVGDHAEAIVIQPDGHIVLVGAGAVQLFNHTDFALARYNDDGSLDPTFGVGGKVLTDFSSFFDPEALVFSGAGGAALQSNGKIVAAGGAGDLSRARFALARYNTNGSVDAGFGDSGRILTQFSPTDSAGASAVAIQQDGKIVAVGSYQDIQRGDDFALARYLGDPAFDLCLQDDSNGNLLRVNTTTGDYQFDNCGGLTIGGTGSITRRGGIITLQQTSGDRRVLAKIDTASNIATASVQLLSQGGVLTITDRNITNNTCACR